MEYCGVMEYWGTGGMGEVLLNKVKERSKEIIS